MINLKYSASVAGIDFRYHLKINRPVDFYIIYMGDCDFILMNSIVNGNGKATSRMIDECLGDLHHG